MTSTRLRQLRLPILISMTLALGACATQLPMDTQQSPGFLHGLLHGFIMLFSLIGSAFNDVRIYAYPNAGGLYDLGYVLGVLLFFIGSGMGAGVGRR